MGPLGHADQLLALFQASVPGGQLRLQRLPCERLLRLWLADPETFGTRFDDQVVSAIMAAPPYWSFCWASGQVLAGRILANPDWVAGKRVLDLGCGSGVVAIAAALAGARESIACDLDAAALVAAQANAGANGAQIRIAPALEAIHGPVDVLFGADILYDPDNRPLLSRLPTLADEVWVADSRVKDFSEPGYVKVATEQATTFPDMGEWEGFNQVNLYRAARVAR
ncbi:50S ribosomal protein L11 methyltransferase [Simiduia agarivorans]|uniref:Methyltransferase n=1 Tax=Simiduia agarivorans (strain DSM 21679 / JCM 13881 / BCRC 17597 / SA1) TaxID=1117647 RepID=K4KY49_SIMAS|nr:50S ribosomal protein L11 methyltransferase [Simiduia agarivorans]AFU98872.1 hypothetical protein M5M_08415 [Simiduia agarivorans SA1 = DSM 21679]